MNKCERSAAVGVRRAWCGASRPPLYTAPCGVQDAGVPSPHPGRLRVYPVRVFTGVVALARIEESRLEGKHPRNDQEWSATVCAGTHGRRVAWREGGLTSGAAFPCNPLPDGVGIDGTACVQKADGSDCQEAIGQNMLEEPAEKRYSVARGGSWACPANFPGGEGDRAVLAAHDAAGGDGHCADLRGEIFAGGVAVWIGLAVDVPGHVPALRIDMGQECSLGALLLEESAGDGRKRLDRDKEVGA